MSKPILVANWKNHPSSLGEAKAILKKISLKKPLFKKLSLFIAPPLSYFESVSEKVRSFGFLASQDLSEAGKTTTGAVTIDILKSFGAKLAILGHSERRALGETSKDVAAKVLIAAQAGITPLVCVGELKRDKDGDYFEFLREQIETSLASLEGKVSKSAGLAIAYEPVWAIGEAAIESIEPKDLSEAVIFIKKILSGIFGRKVSDKIPVLYGGSVDEVNASSLLSGTGIRGFLVGRASLDGNTFRKIAEAMLERKTK